MRLSYIDSCPGLRTLDQPDCKWRPIIIYWRFPGALGDGSDVSEDAEFAKVCCLQVLSNAGTSKNRGLFGFWFVCLFAVDCSVTMPLPTALILSEDRDGTTSRDWSWMWRDTPAPWPVGFCGLRVFLVCYSPVEQTGLKEWWDDQLGWSPLR